MRDLVAGITALVLLVVAASLATTLRFFRKRRQTARSAQQALGRTVIAEIPAGEDLVLFSEDAEAFYYGALRVPRSTIVAVRVLINGTPIAAVMSRTHAEGRVLTPTSFDDRPEGIARDRWDVALETTEGTVLVECGAIRERVSQELARAVFDAVRTAVE